MAKINSKSGAVKIAKNDKASAPKKLGKISYRNLVVSVMHEISKAVVRTVDVSVLLEEVLGILERQMGLARGTVTLLRGDVLVIKASCGLTSEEKKRGVYRMGEGITGQVARAGKSRVVPDISKSDNFLNRTQSRASLSKTAFICVPILSKEKVIGTLSMDRTISKSVNLENDKKLLETVANVIADAVSVLSQEMAEAEKLKISNRELREKLESGQKTKHSLGSSSAMLKVFRQISLAGENSAHVLIRGEVGSGKDFALRSICNSSMWKDKPFYSLNSAPLKDAYIERELFGSERAREDGRKVVIKGMIEKAENGGIVYLDAMGLIGKPLQLKLLKFVTDGIYRREGGTEDLRSRARIIASTTGNLEERLKTGIIREDFYFAMSIFTISIPPLRERRRDIPKLAEFFLSKYSELYSKNLKGISPAAMNMLCAYHWPSNVRELENAIERAVLISATRELRPSDLPPSLQTPQTASGAKARAMGKEKDFVKSVENFEREIILNALTSNGGNASATARQLSITRRILNYKIEQLGIREKSGKSAD